MFLWYVGGSVLIVLLVFASRGVDYRLVAFGSILPLLVDLPAGHPAFGHTLLFPVVLLFAVMAGTAGRSRLVRRRLICVPIGVFCGLVLSGAWRETSVLMWPTLGWTFPDGTLLPVWWVVLLEEVAGLVVIWFVVGLGSLYEPARREEFFRTGRIEVSE